MRGIGQTRRHLRRYREIVAILAKHSLGALVDELGLAPYLKLPKRAGAVEQDKRSIPQRLRMAVEELGPTFIKFAQILSTRPDLIPPPYLAELIRLQDTVPPAPWEMVKAEIEEELGALDRIFASFESQPVAAASLGQVHCATLQSGEEVVVKARRPAIEEIVNVDLEILRDLAQRAQKYTPLSEFYELPEIVEDFVNTLRNEMNYLSEGRNADRFRQNFADEAALYIPRVYWDHTTEKVLTLERIRGIKINDIGALDAAGLDRHQVALNSARIIIKEVLEDGFFHADPHPGNFFVMDGGVIGAMDFGMVGYLTPRDREQLVRLYTAAVQLNVGEIVGELVHVGAAPPHIDRMTLERDIQRLLTKYYGLPLKEIRARQVMDEVTPIAFRHHLRLPTQWWLLGKTLAMMEGLGLQLDPDFDIFEVSRPYVDRLIRQMFLPRDWGKKLAQSVLDWSELWTELPQRGPRLLDQMERGEFQLTLNLKGQEKALSRLDRLANRLAVSVLVASFIVSLALLIPAYAPGEVWGFRLSVVGFAVAAALGLWLLLSIMRSDWR
ncbi:MAG: AarF/ABC1/UbiB kinase family protein [Chloroflexi bacterium]|nr:AarF/ABC1/UbiB kinase family protein [Chloroflexota bacterium]